jgi:hypothetical protein
VLCDGQHDEDQAESEQEVLQVVATQSIPAAPPIGAPFQE